MAFFEKDGKMMYLLSKAWNAIGMGTRDISNVIVVRGSGSTIPGKINETPAAIIIDTGAEVSIVGRGLVRAEDVETIPEMVRLKTITGESTPIMGEAWVEICIGQLRIRHRALVASTEDDFIVEMDLISRRKLTIDQMREVLRLGNEEFKLNQRCRY